MLLEAMHRTILLLKQCALRLFLWITRIITMISGGDRSTRLNSYEAKRADMAKHTNGRQFTIVFLKARPGLATVKPYVQLFRATGRLPKSFKTLDPRSIIARYRKHITLFIQQSPALREYVSFQAGSVVKAYIRQAGRDRRACYYNIRNSERDNNVNTKLAGCWKGPIVILVPIAPLKTGKQILCKNWQAGYCGDQALCTNTHPFKDFRQSPTNQSDLLCTEDVSIFEGSTLSWDIWETKESIFAHDR